MALAAVSKSPASSFASATARALSNAGAVAASARPGTSAASAPAFFAAANSALAAATSGFASKSRNRPSARRASPSSASSPARARVSSSSCSSVESLRPVCAGPIARTRVSPFTPAIVAFMPRTRNGLPFNFSAPSCTPFQKRTSNSAAFAHGRTASLAASSFASATAFFAASSAPA